MYRLDLQDGVFSAKLALEALEVPVGVSNFLLFFIPVALSRYYYQLNYYLSVWRNRTNETCNVIFIIFHLFLCMKMEAIEELIGQWQKDRLSPSQVAEKFSKCVPYVTCEPCIMCASTLSFLGMKEVYYACGNDKFGGCGSVLLLHLEKAQRGKGYKCRGIMADEAVSLFKCFYERNPYSNHSHLYLQLCSLMKHLKHSSFFFVVLAPKPHRPVVQRERT
ncbi:unnamed protein product [Brassica napus]|uniref:(rape) hypothetical protein n=1 Tax=Brassica napus TaxID=3708 RepID=A0A816M4J0_BRANA|nr:unnamed protein product [Brassica napus]